MVTRQKAADYMQCREDEIDFYAWPEIFGSTAGPFKGIGGAAMTTFTMSAWLNRRTNESIICCGDKILRKSTKFTGLIPEY